MHRSSEGLKQQALPDSCHRVPFRESPRTNKSTMLWIDTDVCIKTNREHKDFDLGVNSISTMCQEEEGHDRKSCVFMGVFIFIFLNFSTSLKHLII